jgi:hypothetical protein
MTGTDVSQFGHLFLLQEAQFAGFYYEDQEPPHLYHKLSGSLSRTHNMEECITNHQYILNYLGKGEGGN